VTFSYWRRNEINFPGARRGPKLEAQRPEPGMGFLGWGGKLLHQLRGLGKRCKLPYWCLGRSPGCQEFCSLGLQFSCSAVLLLDLGVIHSSFCCSARKLLRGRKETFAPAVSALRGRVPPLPRSSDAFAFSVI